MPDIVCNCGEVIRHGTLLGHLRDAHGVSGDGNSLASRLVVIDHTKDGLGNILERWDVDIDLDYQDKGRTLKVFLRDRK